MNVKQYNDDIALGRLERISQAFKFGEDEIKTATVL